LGFDRLIPKTVEVYLEKPWREQKRELVISGERNLPALQMYYKVTIMNSSCEFRNSQKDECSRQESLEATHHFISNRSSI
jgi:hypothetical protein